MQAAHIADGLLAAQSLTNAAATTAANRYSVTAPAAG